MDSWAWAYLEFGMWRKLPEIGVAILTANQIWCTVDLETRLRAAQFTVGV